MNAFKKLSTIIFSMSVFLIFIISTTNFTIAKATQETLRLSVYAGYDFRRIIDDTTPFYSDKQGNNLLFYLPYTYYVRVLEKGDWLSRVEIVGENVISIDGYVPTDMLFDDDLAVSSPYVNLNVKLKNTATMYDSPSCLNAIHIVYSDRDLNYYGTVMRDDGVRLFYVSYFNKIGYVYENDVVPFTIPNHPNELTFIVTEEPSPPETNQEPTEETQQPDSSSVLSNVRIIIFTCLIFAGLLAIVFAFKNKQKPIKETNYYDENDYE